MRMTKSGAVLAVRPGFAGDDLTHKVWVSFRCRTGFASSYTLLVR